MNRYQTVILKSKAVLVKIERLAQSLWTKLHGRYMSSFGVQGRMVWLLLCMPAYLVPCAPQRIVNRIKYPRKYALFTGSLILWLPGS